MQHLTDAYAGQSAGEISGKLSGRAKAAGTYAAVEALAAVVQLAGASAVGHGAAAAILAGSGAVTGALAVYQFIQKSSLDKANHLLQDQASRVAQDLVSDGPTPKTYVDGRFFEYGNFSHIHEVRNRSNDAVISRSAQIGTTSPVQLQDIFENRHRHRDQHQGCWRISRVPFNFPRPTTIPCP